VASWAAEDREIELQIDFNALDLSGKELTGDIPAIELFQEAQVYNTGDKLMIPAGKGKIVILRMRRIT
jgi:hypothetical protein